MSTLQLVFIYSAVLGGLFFVVQLVLSLLGGDGDGGMETDGGIDVDLDSGQADGHGHSASSHFFELFSLKTIASGVTFFGLVGLASSKSGATPPQSLIFGVLAGVASLYFTYWLYKQLWRLQMSGNEDIRNAIGLPAQIYVPVPPQSSGLGKVHLTMQGRLVEYQAMTEDPERMKTGEPVVVIDVVNTDTVLVSRNPNFVAELEPTTAGAHTHHGSI